MTEGGRIAELHQRLDELEAELATRKAELTRSGSLSTHHQERVEEIEAKAAAVRERLHTAGETGWEESKHGLEADWQGLLDSFGRWIQHLDDEYRQNKS